MLYSTNTKQKHSIRRGCDSREPHKMSMGDSKLHWEWDGQVRRRCQWDIQFRRRVRQWDRLGQPRDPWGRSMRPIFYHSSGASVKKCKRPGRRVRVWRSRIKAEAEFQSPLRHEYETGRTRGEIKRWPHTYIWFCLFVFLNIFRLFFQSPLRHSAFYTGLFNKKLHKKNKNGSTKTQHGIKNQ